MKDKGKGKVKDKGKGKGRGRTLTEGFIPEKPPRKPTKPKKK